MLDATIAAAIRAGRLIEEVRRGGFEVFDKGDAGPVTAADRAADAALKEDLLGLLNVGWLSEESADDGARLSQKKLWVVDPLDGTKEFVKGLPEYAVAVALVEDGIPILAVVHNPATGETYAAERGQGATRNGERISVREGQTILASRTEMKAGEFAPFASYEVRPIGSIEYKLGLIAAGEAASTFSRGPKWEWDVCAGALIVAEAGGIVTDLDGNPFRFNQAFPKVRGVIAGAPVAYAAVRAEIERLPPSARMDELNPPKV